MVTTPARSALLLHGTFVLIGIVTTLLGPVLPVLVSWWTLDDRQAGVLFAAQFVGSMLGSVLSSAGMTRVGFRWTLVAGLLTTAVGVAMLGYGVYAIGLAAIFTYGVGLGLTMPTTNLYIARAYPDSRAAALNVLNLAWAVGAVGAPAVVAMFHEANAVSIFLFGLAAALVLMALPLARISEPGRHAAEATPADAVPSRPSTSERAGPLLFGGFLFLCVGTESSVAGWVALYANRLDVIAATLSVATPSLFWAALLAGRAAAPAVLRLVAEARLIVVCLLLATSGVAALMASRSAATLALSVIACGLGLSTVFPLTVAQFTRDMERRAARTAGPVFVLAGFGGAVLPPLVGVVSAATGSLTAGLVIPLVGCLAMLAVAGTRAAAAPHA